MFVLFQNKNTFIIVQFDEDYPLHKDIVECANIQGHMTIIYLKLYM